MISSFFQPFCFSNCNLYRYSRAPAEVSATLALGGISVVDMSMAGLYKLNAVDP